MVNFDGPKATLGDALADTFIMLEPGAETAPQAAGVPAAAAAGTPPAFAVQGGVVARGTRFDDNIRGTNRDDDIFARGGDDVVRGRDGDDLIDGGGGRDRLFGGDGADALFGGRGRDSLYGGNGRDNFWFDEDHRYDLVLDFQGDRDTLVVDGEQGDFAGARWRDIDIEGGRRFDELYVFDDVVARIYGDIVTRDDILLLT